MNTLNGIGRKVRVRVGEMRFMEGVRCTISVEWMRIDARVNMGKSGSGGGSVWEDEVRRA